MSTSAIRRARHRSNPVAGCLGAVAGVALAFVLTVTFGEMEGFLILGIILPLPLAAVGATCGVMSARRGPTAALPLALAVGIGVPATFAVTLFARTLPEGPVAYLILGSFWGAGGVLGGLAKATTARSAIRGLAEVIAGAALGAGCFCLFLGYFVAALSLLNGE